MKQLITAVILTATALTAQAADFQKVYELPGMTAAQIEKAFGPAVIDAGSDGLSKFQAVMNTQRGAEWVNSLNNTQQGNIRCNIAISDWLPAVNTWNRADVVVEAKDGRARVTVQGLDTVVGGPGYKTCVSSIEKVVDARMANLKTLDSNW
jgi:hypothetical protein